MITLDLPVPPSVNRTRKVDWKAAVVFKSWIQQADTMVIASRLKLSKLFCFSLHIVISEKHTRIDLDNGIKWLIDYLRRIEVIADDSPKHLRKLTVEWGEAPEGARVTVAPWPEPSRQALILQWAVATFGHIALDRKERARRLLEETIELAQAEFVSMDELEMIARRVFSRPPGNVAREIGQVQVTLECLAENLLMSADGECEKEFARVRAIPTDDHRNRHLAKVALGIAAP